MIAYWRRAKELYDFFVIKNVRHRWNAVYAILQKEQADEEARKRAAEWLAKQIRDVVAVVSGRSRLQKKQSKEKV
jgi:hypothetical protein